MCGILAGSGRLSNRKYQGIAPECKLICGKVLDAKGNGDLLKLLQALEWVIALRKYYPIRLINISIEMGNEQPWKPEEYRQLLQMLDFLWQENVLVVVAAGNRGPNSMSVSPLGVSTKCICVGCHDEDFKGRDGKNCMEYSGRGPVNVLEGIRLGRDALKKPDIVAPGTQIMSCYHGLHMRGKKYVNAYIEKSGTSMATPIVSGALALALQKYPQISNEDLKRNLLNSARDLGEKWCIQGAGILDIHKFLYMLSR